MSNYNCYDEQEDYYVASFPEDTIGLNVWNRLMEGIYQLEEPITWEDAEDPLLAHLSLLAGSAARESAPGLHRGQKVCPTGAKF